MNRFWTTVLVLSLFACSGFADATFYVSPDGHNSWTGLKANAEPGRSDGPFATPARAREAARAILAERGKNAGSIQIILRGGTYFLTEPLEFTPADSGTAQSPIVWSAYENETPILSGGTELRDWQKTVVNGRESWRTKWPAPAGTWRPHQLWINGEAMTNSRWPKQRTLAVAKPTSAPTTKPADWRTQVSEFQFAGDDLKNWSDLASAEAIVTSRWVESRLPISSIDMDAHTVHSSKKSVFLIEPADRFWLENVRECLTEPGEFYVDPRDNSVYVIPPAGVSMMTAQVIVPRLTQIVRLEGNAAAGKYVEHLTFRGLRFANSEWYYDHFGAAPGDAKTGTFGNKPDPALSGFHQAAIGVSGAILGTGVRNCTFDHCTVSNVGSYGIELAGGCKNNRITHCTLEHLGAGGIKIGETVVRPTENLQTFANEISDCTIADGGNLFPSCVALWIGQSHDNLITHNDSHGFWYTGISIGWTWGYGQSAAQRNAVIANHIHHIGIKSDQSAPILSDMGGIYTLGNQEGGMIRGNLFHDIAALKYGGWGIYFDEGTTHLTAQGNLVYRTTHGGFHQHYGQENIVANNIFAFGRDAQIQRTRIEDHLSFTFERNIVYWDHGNLFSGDWKKENAAFNNNVYWHSGPGEIRFARKTWDQWREAGMDKDSRIADPHFADPERGDFRPLDAGAVPKGFEPVDVARVGPRN